VTGPFSRCLSILIYHRVVPEHDPLVPDAICAAEFDWQLALLNRWFTMLSLREATARLLNGTLPIRAACITFDDGYADNVTVALPCLRRHRLTATFFVATSFIDGGRMWNDTVIEAVRRVQGDIVDARFLGLGMLRVSSLKLRRQAIASLLGAIKYLPPEERQERVDQLGLQACGNLPSDLMMTAEQVRYLLASGMEIGAHTISHPILASLDSQQAGREISECKNQLEAITGTRVSLFAYPNGKPRRDYRAEHVDLVKRLGFEAAVSTAWGVAHAGSDPFQLPRFTPWDKTPGRFLARLLCNTFQTDVEQV
jgi:peptidoglycan/xylan/chitin deacetylase (PgdA/CDA1 family)